MQKKDSKKSWKSYLPVAIGIVVVVAAVTMGILFRHLFKIEAAEPKKQIQQVTIFTPPPPPPPPPKEEIEEPEVEEEIPEELPEPAAPENSAEAPASEELGVDADGSTGSDGFGLAAKKGGRGILGGIGGYEQTVRTEINEAVIGDKTLRHLDYVANVTLKLSDSGEIETFSVEMVSGSEEAKAALEALLRSKKRMSQKKPLEAASLIKLRVRSML